MMPSNAFSPPMPSAPRKRKSLDAEEGPVTRAMKRELLPAEQPSLDLTDPKSLLMQMKEADEAETDEAADADFQPGARTTARFRARSHGRVVRVRADEGVASLRGRRRGGARGGVRRG